MTSTSAPDTSTPVSTPTSAHQGPGTPLSNPNNLPARALDAVAQLSKVRPRSVSSLELRTEPGADGDERLTLYYGIDPASLHGQEGDMEILLAFLEQATRDIESASGAAPVCVATTSNPSHSSNTLAS